MDIPDHINSPDNDNIEELDTHLVNSYIDFIATSNVSLHSMLEIINNQQSSFNQILSHHMVPSITRYIPGSIPGPTPGSIIYNIYNSSAVPASSRPVPGSNRAVRDSNRTIPGSNRTVPILNRPVPILNRPGLEFSRSTDRTRTTNSMQHILNPLNNIRYSRINMQNIVGHIISDLSDGPYYYTIYYSNKCGYRKSYI